MARPIFYHGIIKKLVVAVGSLFDDIHFVNDHNETIKVPISYSPREKFIEFTTAQPSFDATHYQITFPIMGFEMTGIKFAPERFSNPLNLVEKKDKTKWTYTRVPYDFFFNVYIATKTIEDSLKIVEQILPFFTPEFTVTINDLSDLETKTDVPIVLTNSEFNIEYEGDFSEKRIIEWTLGLVAKAYLYADIRLAKQIKTSIINLYDFEFDRKFEQLVAEVNPRTAKIIEPHTIDETINTDSSTWRT